MSVPTDRFPDVLIIGAMKSGTTGLFMDLCCHPGMFLAESKEPECLCHDRVLEDEGRREYASLYKAAATDQLACDASTAYSKLPDYPGVVDRATQLLPADFKVIYVVRDPIDRMASQFQHERQAGIVPPEIDQVVRETPRYLNYSRYGYQLQPWIEAIGRERILVIRFEDYRDDRQATVVRVCGFLGLPADQLATIEAVVHNQGARKPVAGKFWKFVRSTWWYQKVLRPLTSLRVRLLLQRWVLPKSQVKVSKMSDSTRAWLHRELEPDTQLLEELLAGDCPEWAHENQVTATTGP